MSVRKAEGAAALEMVLYIQVEFMKELKPQTYLLWNSRCWLPV